LERRRIPPTLSNSNIIFQQISLYRILQNYKFYNNNNMSNLWPEYRIIMFTDFPFSNYSNQVFHTSKKLVPVHISPGVFPEPLRVVIQTSLPKYRRFNALSCVGNTSVVCLYFDCIKYYPVIARPNIFTWFN
jgi:hypothetical protein